MSEEQHDDITEKPTPDDIQVTSERQHIPSTLVDSFAHYSDRKKINLREDARLFSNSEVQTFKRCRRKWWLAWYRGMRMKFQKPTGARAIGDRIHRALSYWYRPVGEKRIHPSDALEALIESDWEQIEPTLTDDNKVSTQLDFFKDADVERAMLEGYMQWIAETGEDANLIILESEKYIEARFPITNETLPVYIIAKLDVRARRVSDNVLLFIDHKTVADFTSKTAMIHMDEQMLKYHLIEWLNAIQDRCDGALYNMIRRVKRTRTAKPPFYQRVEVRHNIHEIASFKHRLEGSIEEIINTERRLNNGELHYRVAYPTPSSNCTWDCDFVSVCPLFDDGSRAEAMLENYYVQGDPLSYYSPDKGAMND